MFPNTFLLNARQNQYLYYFVLSFLYSKQLFHKLEHYLWQIRLYLLDLSLGGIIMGTFQNVSKTEPCAICGKQDWCSIFCQIQSHIPVKSYMFAGAYRNPKSLAPSMEKLTIYQRIQRLFSAIFRRNKRQKLSFYITSFHWLLKCRSWQFTHKTRLWNNTIKELWVGSNLPLVHATFETQQTTSAKTSQWWLG